MLQININIMACRPPAKNWFFVYSSNTLGRSPQVMIGKWKYAGLAFVPPQEYRKDPRTSQLHLTTEDWKFLKYCDARTANSLGLEFYLLSQKL